MRQADPGAHGTASLAQTMSSRFSERSYFENKVESAGGEDI